MSFSETWARTRQRIACRRKVAPPRVDTYSNGEKYWTTPPPLWSSRLHWWLERIEAGWRPGRRICRLGYYCKAEYFGVYIWEYLNVLSPRLDRT